MILWEKIHVIESQIFSQILFRQVTDLQNE